MGTISAKAPRPIEMFHCDPFERFLFASRQEAKLQELEAKHISDDCFYSRLALTLERAAFHAVHNMVLRRYFAAQRSHGKAMQLQEFAKIQA
jgi:hypothetical protein